ncbi:MAG: hypothetical protein J3K34DRAFT_408754 [Monoraphidium minutum]|nr:MAG: hypothetical protein J3K34DRAFT_408754 [Monoraphidium minutum]
MRAVVARPGALCQGAAPGLRPGGITLAFSRGSCAAAPLGAAGLSRGSPLPPLLRRPLLRRNTTQTRAHAHSGMHRRSLRTADSRAHRFGCGTSAVLSRQLPPSPSDGQRRRPGRAQAPRPAPPKPSFTQPPRALIRQWRPLTAAAAHARPESTRRPRRLPGAPPWGLPPAGSEAYAQPPSLRCHHPARTSLVGLCRRSAPSPAPACGRASPNHPPLQRRACPQASVPGGRSRGASFGPPPAACPPKGCGVLPAAHTHPMTQTQPPPIQLRRAWPRAAPNPLAKQGAPLAPRPPRGGRIAA